MFILEERCVPKCSSIVTATKICQAASQQPGATEKEMASKLEAIFTKVESSFQMILCLKVLRLQRAHYDIVFPFYNGNTGKYILEEIINAFPRLFHLLFSEAPCFKLKIFE